MVPSSGVTGVGGVFGRGHSTPSETFDQGFFGEWEKCKKKGKWRRKVRKTGKGEVENR